MGWIVIGKTPPGNFSPFGKTPNWHFAGSCKSLILAYRQNGQKVVPVRPESAPYPIGNPPYIPPRCVPVGSVGTPGEGARL